MHFHAVVDLPVDDDEQHPNPFLTVINPDDNDTFSKYLTQWYDCNDKEFDYLSELNAITKVCKHMQQ